MSGSVVILLDERIRFSMRFIVADSRLRKVGASELTPNAEVWRPKYGNYRLVNMKSVPL